MKSFFKNQDGIAAVEFALIAPILVTLFIGVVDMGLYINDKIKLEMTARSAAEYLIISRDEDGVDENIVSPYYLGMSTPPHTIETELVCECEDGAAIDCIDDICEDVGDYKRRFYNVSLTKTHNTLFVYPGFQSSIELIGEAKLQLD